MLQERDCRQLIYKANGQQGLERSNTNIDSDLWDFAESWIRRFNEASEENAAEKFIYLWVTVNAWATLSVPDRTQNHVDAYLVHSMSADPQLSTRFEELKNNRRFDALITELGGLAPVFQVLWMRNKGVEAWDKSRESRSDFILRMKAEGPYNEARDGRMFAAFAPACAFEHLELGSTVPIDWPHILSMIYQIRCNLFHGGKNYNSSRDRRFIELAYSILWEMWKPELPSNMLRNIRNREGRLSQKQDMQ